MADNTLFDILNSIFTSKDVLSDYPAQTLKNNYFMINRRLAIKYPLQAQLFNNTKINQLDVIKFWNDFLSKGGFPRWIYTPGAAKSKAAKDIKKKVTSKQIESFCNHYNINKRDVDTAMKFFPEEMVAEILEYNKMMDNINSD